MYFTIEDLERLSLVMRTSNSINAGATTFKVRSVPEGIVGEEIVIDILGDNPETRTVTAQDKKELTVAAFAYGHAPDAGVVRKIFSSFGSNGIQMFLDSDVAATDTSLTVRSSLVGIVADLGWLVIDPYTVQCEIRKPTVIAGTVFTIPALTYDHAENDTVLWVPEPTAYVNWFGATGDGVTDDTAAIQAALDAVSAEGGKVIMPTGTYEINDDISPGSNTILEGQGYETLLELAAGKGISITSKNNVIIRNLRTDASSHVLYDMAIEVLDSSDIHISNCFCLDNGGFGIFTWASVTGTSERVWITDNYCTGLGVNDVIGGGPNFDDVTSIVQDVFVERNIVVQDASVGDNYGYAIDMVGVYRIMFRNNLVYGNVVFGSERFPNTYSTIDSNIINKAQGQTACWIGAIANDDSTSPPEYLVFSNNIINQGSIVVKGSATQHAKYIDIVNNTINAAGDDNGIELLYITLSIIAGNIIKAGVDSIDMGFISNLTITGNIFNNSTNGINNTGTDWGSNIIANNVFATVTNPVVNLSAGSKVKNNIGWVTENSGTGTILSAQTTLAVAHGLATTPTVINIAFREQGDNDYGRWWVDTIGAANFTLNVSGDPGASNLNFAWEAKVR